MKKEKKVMAEFDKDHLYGRVFLGAAIILILLVPIIMCLVLNVFPEWSILGKGLVGCIMFIVGGFIEVMTYSPMLGKKGTYLAFFTGNLVNLKLPCAVCLSISFCCSFAFFNKGGNVGWQLGMVGEHGHLGIDASGNA